MKCPLLLVTLLGAAAAGDALAGTPVQKVLQLLQGMKEKGIAAIQEEKVQFAAYTQFCTSTLAEKKGTIDDAVTKTGMLKADIEKSAADAAALGKEIDALAADIAAWTKDKLNATTMREHEKADYDATHKDYSESVAAIDQAIAVLKKQDYTREQAKASLLQVSARSVVKAEAKQAIQQLLQDLPTAPVADGYKFQSGGIVGLLEKLKIKFVDERTALEKEELTKKGAYELLAGGLDKQMEQATEDSSSKAGFKAKKLEAEAAAQAALADVTALLEAETKFFKDLTITCDQKASDFTERQKLRDEELVAIGKAIEVISSPAVSGSASKYSPALLQLQARSAALPQLRASGHSPVQDRVMRFLQGRASSLNSQVLSALAAQAGEDPLEKVKTMIKDLLTRLEEEATADAEHKGWCKNELEANEKTRRLKSEEAENLRAQLEELKGSIATLSQDVAALSEEVLKSDKAVAEATATRSKEKATNEQTVKDSREAQSAVAQAIAVLKDFYGKAGKASALVQEKQGEAAAPAPAIFDSPYKGQQDENGGVVGLLEVVAADFARLEAETSASETASEQAHRKFLEDSKVDKATKQVDIQHKTAKKEEQTLSVATKSKELEGTDKELEAANTYFEKLKPSCIDQVDYKQRVAKKLEEAESLKQALQILESA